ncbi:PTS sugar transporter subunit IIA [Sporosarcina jiandibaonis]|uniref:PTS sugar transporter subunit IIA n=1 Tax=Sporosarcina jiandibaonis TaxID=2715535 RepID=UPI0015552953|nr:PTS glucose transporter subunit IIA [Sporosarcina jiandibaonis]
MLKKLFGKKEVVKEETIMASLTGSVVQLEEVPDPVFSQKMLGDGIAIMPTDGIVVAPFDGEIVQLFPTKHAIGLRGKSGLEVLVHIGLETVALNGEGFEAFVKQGDKVSAGDKLVKFDMDFVKENANSLVTPITLTNGDVVESFTVTEESSVVAGETKLLTVHLK